MKRTEKSAIVPVPSAKLNASKDAELRTLQKNNDLHGQSLSQPRKRRKLLAHQHDGIRRLHLVPLRSHQ